MYPYPVVLMGLTDCLPGLEQALTESAAKLVGRYADLRAVRIARAENAEPATYLVRLRCEEDVLQLRLLADAYPGEPIVGIVEGECDTATFLRLNRAGATQIVMAPLVAADLIAALDRVSRQFGRIPSLGRVVTICGVIGGVGASSLAVNLTYELATRWKKVCILAEPMTPFGQLASHLPLKAHKPTDDLYFGQAEPDLAMLQNTLTPVTDLIRVIVAPQPILPLRRPGPKRLQSIVEASRQISETVLLDLPPAFNDGCLEILERSDDIIFVSNTSIRGLQTLQDVLTVMAQRPGAGRVHAVVNRYSTPDGPDTGRICQKLEMDKIWTIALDASGFAKSEDLGVPLREAAANSSTLLDVKNLAVGIFGPPVVLDSKRTMFSRLLHV
ncbi:hypothetical protein BH11PLA2_BH11PLA2_28710 [soil metagenome]